MATPGKKKEKKKPIPVKTSLNNPYSPTWSLLEKGQKGVILKTLKEKMDALGFCKTQVQTVFRSKRKGKKDSKPVEGEEPARPQGWSDKSVRRQLAIGINEVTKGLERNELSLVLVCSTVKPANMVSHLIPLSLTREVPACQVPELSVTLSGILGVNSVLALGFRRESKDFTDTVQQIVPKIPPLRTAWVSTERGKVGPESTDQGGDVNPELLKTEEKFRDSPSHTAKTDHAQSLPPKNLKRKFDILLEPAEDPSLLLQPLKVKKTIPNPAKIRKPKKKKAQK
ncbi:ribonuclease P protein subunit p38 [Hoplias malabaricus]|uniref:ribonuclease P protein subunit p38 n=1 Tax=Hoplias malabaricus TaxID=27720 RepID=UPI0034621332